MAPPEWRVGLDHDLERLQVQLDFATGILRTALAAMRRTAEAGLAQEAARLHFREDADRAIASLHLHEVAAQMIADLRGRANAESGAPSSAPEAMAQARAQLLADALSGAETMAG
jgi:hypothetical protein